MMSCLDDTIDAHAVVVFTLRWCEFGWSMRRVLRRLGVPFHAHELDAAEFRLTGERLRAELRARAGSPALPQLWIGRRHVGGAAALARALESGELVRWLREAGVPCDPAIHVDPTEALPRWMRARAAA